MHRILLASTALAFAASPALADGHADKCFDKGTLSYVDCPQPAPAPAVAPAPAPIEAVEDEPSFWLNVEGLALWREDLDGVIADDDSTGAILGDFGADRIDIDGAAGVQGRIGFALGGGYGLELDALYFEFEGDDFVAPDGNVIDMAYTSDVTPAATAIGNNSSDEAGRLHCGLRVALDRRRFVRDETSEQASQHLRRPQLCQLRLRF